MSLGRILLHDKVIRGLPSGCGLPKLVITWCSEGGLLNTLVLHWRRNPTSGKNSRTFAASVAGSTIWGATCGLGDRKTARDSSVSAPSPGNAVLSFRSEQ